MPSAGRSCSPPTPRTSWSTPTSTSRCCASRSRWASCDFSELTCSAILQWRPRRCRERRGSSRLRRSPAGSVRSSPAGCSRTRRRCESATSGRGRMNVVHLHLLLNHIPTIGFGVGVALFVGALVGKSRDVTRAALAIFFLTAALAILTYVTGNDAQSSLVNTPGVSPALTEAHETAALIALACMQATAFFAWLGLWMWRGRGDLAAWNRTAILMLAVVTFGLMARAANLGGEIRHPEIRAAVLQSDTPDVEATTTGVTLAKQWRTFVEQHAWVWPACEIL